MSSYKRMISRRTQTNEDNFLEYVLKFIRKKYRHDLSDQEVLNILTEEFKTVLDDKFHFEVGIYMKVIRKSILNYPAWGALRKLTKSFYRLDYSGNRDILQFSNAIRIWTYQTLAHVQMNMMPDLLFLKKKCLKFPNVQDIATALPDVATPLPTASTSKGATSRIPKPLPIAPRARPLTLKCILNWPNVLISLSLPGFQCMRQNLREVSYDLININNMEALIEPVSFNTKQALHTEKDFYTMGADKFLVYELLQRQKTFIERMMTINDKQIKDLDTVFKEFTFNVESGPCIVTPGEYKIFLNKNNYFRLLFPEVPEELVAGKYRDKCDVRMEEILSPAQIVSFSHVLLGEMNKNYVVKDRMAWLKILCLTCRKSFEFTNLSFENVIWHFMDNHHDERLEWSCTNCRHSFPAKYLMENGWRHECEDYQLS